jgi:hypothetical protein
MATSRRKTDETQRGEIHLGDLIRALGTLHGQDDEHAQAIAGCLGFGLAAPDLQPARPTPTVYDRSRPSALPKTEAPATPRHRGLPPPTRRRRSICPRRPEIDAQRRRRAARDRYRRRPPGSPAITSASTPRPVFRRRARR